MTPGRGDEASQQAAAETRIEAAERGGRHEIVVRAPKREGRFGFLGRSPELEVVIRCPEGADLELTTQSADLDARGRLGDIAARSASGDAMLGDTGSLSFTTASGDLSAGAVAGLAHGQVRLGRRLRACGRRDRDASTRCRATSA